MENFNADLDNNFKIFKTDVDNSFKVFKTDVDNSFKVFKIDVDNSFKELNNNINAFIIEIRKDTFWTKAIGVFVVVTFFANFLAVWFK